MAVLIRIINKVTCKPSFAREPFLFKLFARTMASAVNSNQAAGDELQPVLPKIFTPSGDFTCAQIVACALLKMHPTYREAEIVRMNESDLTPTSTDAVVFMGEVNQPESFRFHPEIGSAASFSSLNAGRGGRVPMSCAGMVFAYYGKDILRSVATTDIEDVVYTMYEKVYESFLLEVDALANGFPFGGSALKYTISTDLTARVNRLNIMARRDMMRPGNTGRAYFDRAIAMVDAEFRDRVDYYVSVWGPARELVKRAIETRKQMYQTGEIIKLGTGGVPWNEHLSGLESEMGIDGLVKFVIFEDSRAHDWRVQAVPVAPKSFVLRRGLKEEWRGLRADELSKVSGVPGCVFVHASGFIGGNLTCDGALQMAIGSLSED